jgi:hypothetical protein
MLGPCRRRQGGKPRRRRWLVLWADSKVNFQYAGFTFPPPRRAGAALSELRGLLGRLQRRLRSQSELRQFNAAQVAVFHHLIRHEDATVAELAQVEHMRPQSMGAVVASLQALGLVQGRPDPERRPQGAAEPDRRRASGGARLPRQPGRLAGAAVRRLCSPQEPALLVQAVPLLARLADAED